MLAIKKENPPEFFNAWINNKKEFNLRLREHILTKEQSQVCCYCETLIKDYQTKCHIEHLRPRDKFPQLKNDYTNLLISCETADRCGKAKGNQFNEFFIVPTEENPQDYLTYSANGDIKPTAENNDENKKALETIRILNLNSPRLKKARRTLLIQLKYLKDSGEVEEIEDYFKDYPTFIAFFKKNY
jgi:uncharacterized protein (TIGR02646 family)